MTVHRTTPDPFGVSLWVGDVSSDAPLPLVLNGMADGTIIEPAGRVPLAQAVAGDEYVVVKRDDLQAVLRGGFAAAATERLRKALGAR